MTVRTATYVRVSTTKGQTTENQTLALRAACETRGWTITNEFSDQGISGAKGREQRPGLDALWKAVTAHEIDVVAVWAVDRLGRSLSQLVAFMEDLRRAGDVNLYIHTQGIDTTTPGGMAMFQMVGVFAQFEREMIRGRVNAGLARARAEGKKLGRRTSEREAEVVAMVADGMSTNRIRRQTGVGCSMITRIRAAMDGRTGIV